MALGLSGSGGGSGGGLILSSNLVILNVPRSGHLLVNAKKSIIEWTAGKNIVIHLLVELTTSNTISTTIHINKHALPLTRRVSSVSKLATQLLCCTYTPNITVDPYTLAIIRQLTTTRKEFFLLIKDSCRNLNHANAERSKEIILIRKITLSNLLHVLLLTLAMVVLTILIVNRENRGAKGKLLRTIWHRAPRDISLNHTLWTTITLIIDVYGCLISWLVEV